MTGTPPGHGAGDGCHAWWRERITGALMSYWIYQHLGNLSATELRSNDLLARVRDADRRRDAAPRVRRRGGSRSRRRPGRAVVVPAGLRPGPPADDRLALWPRAEEGHRQMVGDAEFAWIEAQTDDRDYDHLLVGTSVPWLLPRALHDIEAADERLTAGVRGAPDRPARGACPARRRPRALGGIQRLVRAARASLRTDRPGGPGRSRAGHVCVLSGDVHHTYISETVYPDPSTSRVYQLTCSPHAQQHPAPDAPGVLVVVEPVRQPIDPAGQPVRARPRRIHRLADDGRPVLRELPGACSGSTAGWPRSASRSRPTTDRYPGDPGDRACGST